MTNRKSKTKSFFVAATVLILTGLIVSVVVISARRQEKKPQQHPKDWLSSVPSVMSKVKDLEIINPRIVRADTDAPGVAFEIRNNSNRSVTAVDIMCGDAGITKDGLGDEDHPSVIIEPHGTLTAEMNDEMSPGIPIVLSGATYDDGTEDGVERSLRAIHRARAHERERRRAEKLRRQPEGGPNK